MDDFGKHKKHFSTIYSFLQGFKATLLVDFKTVSFGLFDAASRAAPKDMASESMLTRAARFAQLCWRVLLLEIGAKTLQEHFFVEHYGVTLYWLLPLEPLALILVARLGFYHY